MQIKDGLTGYAAGVTSQSRLKTESSAKHAAHIAAENGDAYAIHFEQDSGAVTSDFFYLKNNSDKDLKIYRIAAFTPTLSVELAVTTGVTGTPTSGTALTPVNLLAGGPAANVDCQGRDGDMALTGGNVVDILYVNKSFVGMQIWDFTAPIILPPNTAMVLNVNIDPTADVDGTVYFYFE
jgi:hypothetical protein